ncbi:protein of unknown function DUF45 [Hymenobacter roseosalivarius DSM 11622]|uniref:YgjP-like metallopeptidase domain-containing protein n=1 Tax=Hymenobacter roseosalivarius DSM 11622 TaxID=645990 RepID=A0A1W1VFI8_9BACT|nr:SprT family zinc-dependent metalloprotease [Hymenobacter roseosalivarius]SMB92147.1 protein of unknown function DUF45 [Hymenobacter roseosalivarius DSM 11622]
MPSVQYGDTTIHYTIQDSPHLKAHYLSVDKEQGVVLKGRALPSAQADKLVLKKARWVLQKLELVREVAAEAIVTGSRITYLGRSYYAEVIQTESIVSAQVDFNHSRFLIQVNPGGDNQATIKQALDAFFRQKAQEKLAPRVRKLAAEKGLPYQDLKFRQMAKRWGSCTATNTIILNKDVIKLPFTLIDYVIVHELCHTKVKDHSKEFWAELAQQLPNWKSLDARLMVYGNP